MAVGYSLSWSICTYVCLCVKWHTWIYETLIHWCVCMEQKEQEDFQGEEGRQEEGVSIIFLLSIIFLFLIRFRFSWYIFICMCVSTGLIRSPRRTGMISRPLQCSKWKTWAKPLLHALRVPRWVFFFFFFHLFVCLFSFYGFCKLFGCREKVRNLVEIWIWGFSAVSC